MDAYQQYIHKSRYARYLPEEQRRETWVETVNRYLDFWVSKEKLSKKEALVDQVVHPGSTALAARAAIGIKVKTGQGRPVTGFEHSEIAHVAMPDRRLPICGHYLYVEQALAKNKQPLQYLLQGKPGSKGLAVELETLLTQHLSPVAHVPVLQLSCLWCPVAAGAGSKGGELLLGHWKGCSAQVFK